MSATHQRKLLIACGMTAEAKIIRTEIAGPAGLAITVLAGGGDSAALEAALNAAAGGAGALMSFGIAGGLAPGVAPGDRRVASSVVSDTIEAEAHPAWSAALAKRLEVPLSRFAGVDSPLADVAGKKTLHHATGADLVDMETHVVARVAARHGLPFAAVRVVADAADRALPHAATVGMRPDGAMNLPAVLLSLARDPRQIPGLIATAFDARAAFAALLRCRQLLGRDFGLGDLGLVDFGDPLLDMA